MATIYDVGDRPILTARFTDVDGEPVDPDTIVFTLRAPNGVDAATAAKSDAVRSSTGVYLWDPGVTFNAPGLWFYRATGAGGVICAEETMALVRRSSLA